MFEKFIDEFVNEMIKETAEQKHMKLFIRKRRRKELENKSKEALINEILTLKERQMKLDAVIMGLITQKGE